MISRYHPITLILALGAVIWFVVAFREMIKLYAFWAELPEGFDRNDMGFANALFSILDSLFMLGSAAMVEFLSRIYELLKANK